MSLQGTTKFENPLTLFDAAEEGDADATARMLASGASADERRAPGGETPLMRAAARGHEEVARLLLDAGADANAHRADGFTPLILAVFFGHEAVVRLLVERGADAGARTSLGTTATRWAEARGFNSMAKVLREAEASRPRVVEKEADAQAKAAPKTTSGGGEIFSRRIGRRDVGGEEDSASTFRVRDFLRSWQGALGVLLLLAAFGVAVFALVDRNRAPRSATQPTPNLPQVAAPSLPTPEPSPAFPTPDAGGIRAVPNGVGQPYYVSPGPVSPVTSDVPNELTVVSESDAPATQDAGQSGRRANTNDSAPARNDNASATAPRTTRTPEPEQPHPAAPSTNQTPPPATHPTPRAKVIPWPPQ